MKKATNAVYSACYELRLAGGSLSTKEGRRGEKYLPCRMGNIYSVTLCEPLPGQDDI